LHFFNQIKVYIRSMKKIGYIEYNLLIILVLCFVFSEARAANEAETSQKINNICFYETINAPEAATAPIDFRSKKKKSKARRSSGKVNFETFRQYYNKAMKFYDNKAWLSAARIFEELYPLSIGTAVGDTILFLFADSYFQNRDYQMAAFHFKDYARRYPGTERTELASLNSLKAMYLTSPEYYLDQFITLVAIDEINLFIQTYPNSKFIDECNRMLDDLNDKLAKKDMEMVRMYYHTGYYEAAQITSRNFMKTFSASKFAPEVLFILTKNNYEFARKSVEHKKYSRYKSCLESYETLRLQYPESSFIAEAKKIADEAANQIKKLDEHKK